MNDNVRVEYRVLFHRLGHPQLTKAVYDNLEEAERKAEILRGRNHKKIIVTIERVEIPIV